MATGRTDIALPQHAAAAAVKQLDRGIYESAYPATPIRLDASSPRAGVASVAITRVRETPNRGRTRRVLHAPEAAARCTPASAPPYVSTSW